MLYTYARPRTGYIVLMLEPANRRILGARRWMARLFSQEYVAVKRILTPLPTGLCRKLSPHAITGRPTKSMFYTNI